MRVVVACGCGEDPVLTSSMHCFMRVLYILICLQRLLKWYTPDEVRRGWLQNVATSAFAHISLPTLPMSETTPLTGYRTYQHSNVEKNEGYRKPSPYHVNKIPRETKRAISPKKAPQSKADSKFQLINQKSRDLASEFEFCMVLPCVKKEFTPRGKEIVNLMMQMGLELFIYHASQETKEIMVLGRTPLDVVREFAESSEYYMMLDPVMARAQLESGDAEKNIAPVFIEHRPDICNIAPFDFIYVPYHSRREALYAKTVDCCSDNAITDITNTTNTSTTNTATTTTRNHPFRELDRLKITSMILQSPTHTHSIQIRQSILDGHIIDVFPLHNYAKKCQLRTQWTDYPFKPLPLVGIKEYFGEKVGLYFAFAQHLSTSLLYPVCIGVPLQVVVYLYADKAGKPVVCKKEVAVYIVVRNVYFYWIACNENYMCDDLLTNMVSCVVVKVEPSETFMTITCVFVTMIFLPRTGISHRTLPGGLFVLHRTVGGADARGTLEMYLDAVFG